MYVLFNSDQDQNTSTAAYTCKAVKLSQHRPENIQGTAEDLLLVKPMKSKKT